MRQVVLDTETTGLEPQSGHRVIEIGCVEVVNRRLTGRRYQQFLDPKREIDGGAAEVHGLTTRDLVGKPEFMQIVDEFMRFIKGSELIIHNAPFDIGFLNMELARVGSEWGAVENHCEVLDTLKYARELHPGQRNSLDALCRRYDVANSHRELHGALLDAELLAEVYLVMTGGQECLNLADSELKNETSEITVANHLALSEAQLAIVRPSNEEMEIHAKTFARMAEMGATGSLWMMPSSEE